MRTLNIVWLLLLPLFAGCAATTPASAPPSTARSIHWQPWSDDVFARAKSENKFVFMDLEAVWCHWCHVMDEITYRDPSVIALMNDRYIALKVDQDSRPDLSNRYENYGWPATVVFNADGGEIVKRQGYIPPRPMAALLSAIIKDPTPGPSVEAEEGITFGTADNLSPDLRKQLEANIVAGYDTKQGGWGDVHKFVDWDAVEYCMTKVATGDMEATKRARQTLTAGLKLIDPVWGGVYQYSTDGDWVHPHYEKLIAFQANLMRIYALAFARWHDPQYLEGARKIRGYVRQFLTSPGGAFYVSQDADLVQGEHSGEYFALSDAARRAKGIPRVDTHIYSRENGGMIEALATYARFCGDDEDIADAARAAQWIIEHRALEGGGFHHDEKDAAGPYLDDTLAMDRAFLELYHTTADRAWLGRAQSAARFIGEHFQAGAGQAGFVTAVSAAKGALASRPQIDENVSAARFFNLLWRYTGNKAYSDLARQAMRYLSAPQVAGSRKAWVAGILLADSELASEPLHVTVVGAKSESSSLALFREGQRVPTGYIRLEWWDNSEGPLPNPDVQYPQLSRPSAFLCTGTSCSSPMRDPKVLADKLAKAAGTVR